MIFNRHEKISRRLKIIVESTVVKSLWIPQWLKNHHGIHKNDTKVVLFEEVFTTISNGNHRGT